MKKQQTTLLGLAMTLAAGLGGCSMAAHEETAGYPPESLKLDGQKAYLSKTFPDFITTAKNLGAALDKPPVSSKALKNEWHEVYHIGYCKDLPPNWTDSLSRSFGKTVSMWGKVRNATASNPTSFYVRHDSGSYFHLHQTEFNDSYFQKKPWYKSWIKSETDIKSRYLVAIICESNPERDYHRDYSLAN